MKIKALSIILSIAMVFSCLASITSFSAFAEETTEESVYTIAGNKEEIFGLIWYKYITKDNTMQKSGDVYVYELKDVQVQTDIEFSVIEHKPDGKTKEYGNRRTSYGDFRIYTEFRVAKACDVTITFNPETHVIDVLGDGVRQIRDDVVRVYAYSRNSDTFGTTEENPYPIENEMTLGEDGVYSVTFKDVQPEEDIKIDIKVESYGNIILGFYGFNYCGIDVVKPCDVTVYFEAGKNSLEDSKIWADGDGVVIRTKPLIREMYVCGDGFTFNYTDSNKMTQTDDYVFRLRADNFNSGEDYFFQIRDLYTDGIMNEVYYGEYDPNPVKFGVDKIAKAYPIRWINTHFEVPYDNASVLITLDLTNYDYVTKQNASLRIDLIGDVCGDGKISVTDATELQKSLSDIVKLTDNQNALADVNGDGEVNVKDVTAIQKIAVQ